MNHQLENINPISPNTTDKSLELLLEKAYSPYKPTLKSQVRANSLLAYLKNFSRRLYKIAVKNPYFLSLLSSNRSLITLLRDNEKLLSIALNKSTSLNEFIENPSGFVNKALAEKPKNVKAAQNTDLKKQLASFRTEEESAINIRKAKQNLQSLRTETLMPAVTKPHALGAEIIAKAHIENPNTGITVGEFKTFQKNNIKIPFSTTDENKLIFNREKAYAINPALLGMLGAISATTNYLKVKNASEKNYEAETQSELENAHEETLKSVSEVNEAEPTTRIIANL